MICQNCWLLWKKRLICSFNLKYLRSVCFLTCVCPQTCPRRACIRHCSCRLWAVSRTGLCLSAGSSTVSCCLAFRASMPVRWRHGASKRSVNIIAYLHIYLFVFWLFEMWILCCRSSGLSRILSAVKNRLVSSRKRWDHRVFVKKYWVNSQLSAKCHSVSTVEHLLLSSLFFADDALLYTIKLTPETISK